MTSIAIIGGGPAGFMAAITAKENNPSLDITVFDKSDMMKTILYTGNGRCNLANATYDTKELASNYPRGEKFLYSIFSRFGVSDTLQWFQKHGVDVYAQEDLRIFPKSDDASTVREMFLERARKIGIKLIARVEIKSVSKDEHGFIVIADKRYRFDKLVLATGGNAKNIEPNGYSYAESLGHSIIDLKPALSSLMLKDKRLASLSGVSIKDVELWVEPKKKFTGGFVYTHKGISGPVVYKISSVYAYSNYSQNEPLPVKVNFVPAMTQEELEKDILKECEINSKKCISNIIKKYVPQSLAEKLLTINGIDFETKASVLNKVQRKIIVKFLAEMLLESVGTVPDGEIVTAGGVKLKEVNPKTMESKTVEGLYFCGEVLDIDGFTGGFNLQACWSTGYIVGNSL